MAHTILKSKSFGFNLLKQLLELSKDEKNIFKSFLIAYEGDYWQNSKGFLGPVIEQAALRTFKDRFVSRNSIYEIVSRVADAFLKSPNWYYEKKDVKLEETSDENKNLDKLLTRFWNKNKLEQKMQQALNSRLVCGRGGLRIYIPANKKNEDGSFKAKDLAGALESIKVEFINPRKAKLFDEDGDKFSIINYQSIRDYDTQEKIDIIEFSFTDDDQKTFIGTVSDKETTTFNVTDLAAALNSEDKVANPVDRLKKDLSSPLDLDSETSFYEISGDPFVTPQMMQQANFINLCLTLAAIAMFETGFQQIITTNAKFEYKEVIDDKTGKKKKIPIGIESGGGVVQNFIGIEKINVETGQKDKHTPGVTIKEPVDMNAFKLGKEIAYDSLLEEASQLHVKISGDAAASAVSRVQAMASFYLRIKKYKADVDAIGSWLLNSVILMILVILPNETLLSEFRAIFDSKIDIGPLSPEEKNFVISMVNNKLVSKETARVLLNIDNPALEKMLIDAQEVEEQEKLIENTKQMNEVNPPTPGISSDPKDKKKFVKK